MTAGNAIALRHVQLHGHDVGFRIGGSGPVVVLLHGLTGSSTTWREVMPRLAENYTVIAPDLLGHGESAKPRGDYSLGAFASGIRDLLVALGVEQATIVGHSLGGGVAMQLAYQFPQRCERLVLVSSGGLGREVSMLLRAVSLPGSELVLPVLLTPVVRRALAAWGSVLGAGGLHMGTVSAEVWRSYAALTRRRNQRAFIHTVRSVIDVSGQRVSAQDRLYLAGEIPTLIVWGARDRIIPVDHAYAAHEHIPHSRLEVVPDAGHFVPFERPDAFYDALVSFMETTEPAATTEEQFRDILLDHLTHLERSS